MNDLLEGIEWYDIKPMFKSVLPSGAELTCSPLSPGLEADVVKLSQGQEHFVLKVWNKSSRPDIARQYRLLEALHRRGISVSEPMGYGQTEAGDGVLLTRYHGTPVTKVNPSIFKKITTILADIHKLSPDELEGVELPRYDFVEYFFPRVEEIPTIKEVVLRLVAAADMRMDRLIHGDFNLGNILEENGQYTVIDWTNGQLGDLRYDVSWACFLLRIYLSESKSLTFLYKYQEVNPVEEEELRIFEALACLRWLLLNQVYGVPKNADTMKKVRKIVRDNPYLDESVLL